MTRTLTFVAVLLCIAHGPAEAKSPFNAASGTELEAFVRRTNGPWLKLDAREARQWVDEDAFIGAFDTDHHHNPIVLPTVDALVKQAASLGSLLHAMIYLVDLKMKDLRCRASATLGWCSARVEVSITYRQKPYTRTFALDGSLTARRRDGSWRYVGWQISPVEPLPPPVFPAGQPMNFSNFPWEEGLHTPAEPGYRQVFLFQNMDTGASTTFVTLDKGRHMSWHHYPVPLHMTVLEGDYYHRRPDGTLTHMFAGESMFYPANETFIVGTVGGARIFLVMDGLWGFIEEPTPWVTPETFP